MESSLKKRRMSYTAAFKLKVIEYAEKNGGNRSSQQQFGVNEKQVREWRKKKAELESGSKSSRSQRVGVKPYWPELEQKVHDWILVLIVVLHLCAVKVHAHPLLLTPAMKTFKTKNVALLLRSTECIMLTVRIL